MKHLSSLFAVVFSISMLFFAPSASATVLGNIELVPNPLEFTNTNVGDSTQDILTVRKKSGFLPVFVFGSFLTHPFGFSQDNGCHDVLLTDSNECVINATFSPNRQAFYHSHIIVVGIGRRLLNFGSLIGRGVRPEVDLDPTEVDFGNQTEMTASPASFVKVDNIGTGNLEVTEVMVSEGVGIFDLDSEDCTAAPVAPGDSCMIGVIFTPNGLGDFSGELQITDNTLNSPHTVPLSGSGTAAPVPAFTLSSNLLDFDLQAINTASSPLNVTLTSSGTGVLAVTSITSSDPAVYALSGSCLSGLPLVLNLGESCQISITFTPDATGDIKGDVTFVSDAQDAPVLAMEGVGFEPGGADFSLSAAQLDFGNLTIGEQSSGQSIIVTNTGNAPLFFQSVVFGGNDPHSFSMIDECGDGVVSIGETCTIEIFFAPQLEGGLSATIILTDENGQVQTILLQGIGVGQQISGGGLCQLRLGSSETPVFALTGLLGGLLSLFLIRFRKFR